MATQRELFCRQPGRAIFIDLGSYQRLNDHIMDTILKGLSQFFAVACGLSGPARIPVCSIGVLTSYPEILYPFQSLRGQLYIVANVLRDISNIYQETLRAKRIILPCTGQTVTKACALFKSVATDQCGQLEVSIITCGNPEQLSTEIEQAINPDTMNSLKKVELFIYGSGTNGDEAATLSYQLSSGLVHCFLLKTDVISLQCQLRCWLQDQNNDMEHAQLLLPGEDSQDEICIKCEFKEAVLWPTLTNMAASFCLQPEGMQRMLSTAQAFRAPVYQLRVIERVKISGICESVLFGLPWIIVASGCWRMEWSELEENQKMLTALSSVLSKQQVALVAVLQTPGDNRPEGHFAIFSSGHEGVLFMKSLAVQELWLPAPSTEQVPDPDTVLAMNRNLDKVTLMPLYNPLLHSSGLASKLLLGISNRSAKGQQTLKRVA